VRVVPNKYPLVGVGLGGAHEVVVLSPAHDRSFADLDDAAAAEVFEVLRDRIGRHLADGHTHAHAFINHGKAAGASIEHPHAQVIALDFVPPFVDGMLDRFAAAHRDLVHDALDEARAQNLTIADDDAACWCPPARSCPTRPVRAAVRPPRRHRAGRRGARSRSRCATTWRGCRSSSATFPTT
jgi:UDPglucose--hexose-1-phosphate uridylyltransferase